MSIEPIRLSFSGQVSYSIDSTGTVKTGVIDLFGLVPPEKLRQATVVQKVQCVFGPEIWQTHQISDFVAEEFQHPPPPLVTRHLISHDI